MMRESKLGSYCICNQKLISVLLISVLSFTNFQNAHERETLEIEQSSNFEVYYRQRNNQKIHGAFIWLQQIFNSFVCFDSISHKQSLTTKEGNTECRFIFQWMCDNSTIQNCKAVSIVRMRDWFLFFLLRIMIWMELNITGPNRVKLRRKERVLFLLHSFDLQTGSNWTWKTAVGNKNGRFLCVCSRVKWAQFGETLSCSLADFMSLNSMARICDIVTLNTHVCLNF